MAARRPSPDKRLPVEDGVRLVLAGVSSMTAAAITNPIDVVKIRMQLDNELSTSGGRVVGALQGRKYRGILRGGSRIVREEGVRALSKGLTATLMREGSYGTIRIGSYETIKRLFGATDPANTPLWKKICSGAVSGAIGSALATPTDLVKVRQQAEGPGVTPRYRSTLSAFKEIFLKEGVRGLYVGMGPTVQRAVIVTATQVPSYDHTKHTLLNLGWYQEGTRLHVIASMVAGFMTALTTSPVDVIKTRVMNQKGKDLYKNSMDCFLKTMKAEGPLAFYKGFFPNWLRIGPHTIICFFIFEKLRSVVGMNPV